MHGLLLLRSKQIVIRSLASRTLMDSLCADSEDCEEMNLDIDNSGAVREKVADELADASNVEHSLNGSLCSECPCPSIGTEVSPQPVVATVAVHKSLGVWFGEDGSVVQIHPGEKIVILHQCAWNIHCA